jgi:hypothetical protein
MRAAVPAGSQHFAARRTAPCRNHRGSSPNAWPNGTPLRPTRKASARTTLSTQPAGARFGQFDRAPLAQLEPIDRDRLEPHSSDARVYNAAILRRSNNRTKKGGFHVKPPFLFPPIV